MHEQRDCFNAISKKKKTCPCLVIGVPTRPPPSSSSSLQKVHLCNLAPPRLCRGSQGAQGSLWSVRFNQTGGRGDGGVIFLVRSGYALRWLPRGERFSIFLTPAWCFCFARPPFLSAVCLPYTSSSVTLLWCSSYSLSIALSLSPAFFPSLLPNVGVVEGRFVLAQFHSVCVCVC